MDGCGGVQLRREEYPGACLAIVDRRWRRFHVVVNLACFKLHALLVNAERAFFRLPEEYNSFLAAATTATG